MQAILEKIAIDVTAEQVEKCTKIWGHDGEEFYLVANSKGECDEHGVIEYKVRYDSVKGFSCTCKSGWAGFSGCKNFCWHVRASCMKELEMRGETVECTQEIDEDRGIARNDREIVEPVITPIEVKWNIPAWMLNAPVASHMKNAPREP